MYDNGLDANNEAVVQSRILESLREAKKYVQEGLDAKLIAKATGGLKVLMGSGDLRFLMQT